jgi:F-type H+-transporting ATPase subunit b
VQDLFELLGDAEFWVAVAFVIFVAGMGYLGVHKMVAKSLDDRADRIKAELDEARKLKDEAAALLAEYQRKRTQAEAEAQDIIAGANAEAERLAIEAKAKIEEFISRRTKMAETKIAQAEAQATADVRAAAAEAAVAAAEKLLTLETKGPLAAELIAKGIEDVRKKLN